MNAAWIALTVIRRLTAKRRNIIFFLLVPAIVVSFAIKLLGSFHSATPTVGIVDLEGGEAGKGVLAVFERQFDVIPAENEEALNGLFVDGLTNAGVIVTEDKKIRFTEWRAAPDAIAARITADRLAGRLEASSASPDWIDDIQKTGELVVVKQRSTSSSTDETLAMGLFLMFILGLANSAIATVLEDRSGRMLSRMYMAPVRSFEIALGYFFGMLAAGVGQIAVVMLLCRYVFQVTIAESLSLQILVLFCFLLAALGLATAIAGVARNRGQVSLISSLIITPTCMLGGCFWPVDVMPEVMQRLSNIVPQKWAMDGFYEIAKGGTIYDIGWQLLILILFAAVTIGLGSAVLRPEQESVRG